MRLDPWNRPIEQEQEQWWWILKNPVGFVILSSLAIGLVVIAWHVLRPYPKNSEGTPVIYASTEPLKVKPENPGGDMIPHQDKMVYQKLVKKNDKLTEKDPQIERLVPPPALGSMFDIQDPKKSPTELLTESIQPMAPSPEPDPEPEAEPKSIEDMIEHIPVSDEGKNENPGPGSRKEKIDVAKKAETPKKEKPVVLASKMKGFKIQIASLPTQQKAEQEWARVKKANKDLLAGVNVSYLTIDLGAKGNYTRIQAGGFATRDEAVSICERLKQRRVNCIVIK